LCFILKKTHFRSMQTKQKIERTFLALLKREGFHQLTVKQILDETPVAKSTFYAHYLDKYDVFEKIVSRYAAQFDEIMEKRFATTDYSTLQHLIPDWQELIEKDPEELKLVLSVTTDYADLTKSFQRIFKNHLIIFLKQQPPDILDGVPLDYVAEVF